MLGFYPNDIQLYRQAFTHRSSPIATEDGRWKNNERLEFLGDAVLDAVVADIIYKQYPNRKEGFLTNTRSKIVQRDSLNRIAHEMGLDRMIITSTRLNAHNSYIYGNAFEALIGAIYLDQGYRICCAFVKERIIEKYLPLDKIANKEVNFKSNLIEWSQKNKLEILFELIETFTDQHGSPVFQSRVSLMGMPLGIGIGYTKKESQQSAAKMAIKKIRKDKEVHQLIGNLKKKTLGNKGGKVTLTEYPGEEDDFDEDE
ncbi:MAG: ribonuclease III [Tannerella sp.]|jgi:ribonuclease-3|nr:ribonuclease III [Tannerella sp.]